MQEIPFHHKINEKKADNLRLAKIKNDGVVTVKYIFT